VHICDPLKRSENGEFVLGHLAHMGPLIPGRSKPGA